MRHWLYFIIVNVKSYSNVVYNHYNVPVSDGTIVVIFARCLLWKENVEGKVQVVVWGCVCLHSSKIYSMQIVISLLHKKTLLKSWFWTYVVWFYIIGKTVFQALTERDNNILWNVIGGSRNRYLYKDESFSQTLHSVWISCLCPTFPNRSCSLCAPTTMTMKTQREKSNSSFYNFSSSWHHFE